MMKFLVSLLGLLLWLAPAMAQRHSFISYSVKEGLAQSQVRDILQSRDGYLWIATIGGVSKFDGHHFETYNKANGLLNNVISAIYEMPDSTVVVACQGGIVTIKNSEVKRFPFPKALEAAFVFDMVKDGNKLLLATNGEGIITWDGQTFAQANLNDKAGESENFIRSLAHFGGALLLGTKSSLIRYANGKATTLLAGISVNTMATNGEVLWVTTTRDGVFRITATDTTQFTTDDGLSSMYQKDVCMDSYGNAWFISKNGIIKYEAKQAYFVSLRSIDPSHDDNLKVIFCDKESNIWVGTSGAGILKYTGDQAVTFTEADGLVSEQVMNIDQQPDGKCWFATFGAGVMSFDGEKFETYAFEDGLLNNTVWSLEVIDNEVVWIGTSDGINIYNHGKITAFPHNDKLPFIRVSTIFKDCDSNIWIGTRDGLVRWKGDSLDTPTALAHLNLAEVKSFSETAGTLWITSNSGVYAYHKESETVKHYGKAEGLEEEYVSCQAKDRNGKMWFGTDEGVFCLDPAMGVMRHVRVSKRPSSNVVTFLLHHGDMLWIGSDYGLYSLNTKTFAERDSVEVRSYNEHDGIIGQECNQNAAFADGSAHLWFGTNGGLVRLDPARLPDNPAPEYIICINEIQVNFEPLRNDVDRAFDHKSNRFIFRYSAIHFANPEKVTYSYRMVGQETDWSPAAPEDHTTYANLEPGNYEFQVRARFENAPWSENYASFSFTIRPPFYQRWWFIALCAVAGALAVYGVYAQAEHQRRRKAYLVETENRAKILGLEQQTLNAHMNRHFIFNALNSIQYYINTQDRKQANSYLTNFASLVRKNLDSAQNESISLKDELDRLRLYINLEQMRFKDRFDYEITIGQGIDDEHTPVPSMILQPFVENSIMHGILPSENKGKITISIEKSDDGIRFRIKDNGIGIETSVNQKNSSTSHHVSNGMKITRQRMEVLRNMTKRNFYVDGPRELYDSEGKTLGTVVEINLPDNGIV